MTLCPGSFTERYGHRTAVLTFLSGKFQDCHGLQFTGTNPAVLYAGHNNSSLTLRKTWIFRSEMGMVRTESFPLLLYRAHTSQMLLQLPQHIYPVSACFRCHLLLKLFCTFTLH